MVLIQINKEDKCPVCNDYGLIRQTYFEFASDGNANMWHYYCTFCGAKFVDDNK